MLPDNIQTKLSKFMSKILRHSPEEFGLSLDPMDGSCAVADLLGVLRVQTKWSEIRVSDIEEVVAHVKSSALRLSVIESEPDMDIAMIKSAIEWLCLL